MEKLFEMDAFVSRLRERYNTLGLIPEDLEAFCKQNDGISLKTVKQFLNGKTDKPPTIGELLSFGVLFQCGPDHLLGYTEDPAQVEPAAFDRFALVEHLRELYKENGLIPEDLELFAKKSGLDFDQIRDVINNELRKEPDAALLAGFSSLFHVKPSALLDLKPAAGAPRRGGFDLSAALTMKPWNRLATSPSRITALLGAGLLTGGTFAPLTTIKDNASVVLFSHPSGILLFVLGVVSVILTTIGRYRTLRFPALFGLLTTGWAFLAFQKTAAGLPAWLLLGTGVFFLLLASVLDTGKK